MSILLHFTYYILIFCLALFKKCLNYKKSVNMKSLNNFKMFLFDRT